MARYTMDLDDSFDQTLNDLAQGANTDAKTKADVIRRAVASYKFLKEQEAANNKISITNKDGKVLKDVVLP